MKKKYKLKLWFKVVCFLAVILLIILLKPFLFSKKEEVKEEPVKEEEAKPLITDVVYDKLKDYSIDKEFIIWIDKNYNGSLEKLDNLLTDKEYDKSMWHDATGYSFIVLNDLYSNKYEGKSNYKVLDSKDIAKMDFVGDISLADNWYIMPKYDSRGKKVYGILDKQLVDIMTSSDFMVVNSEFTVSKRGKAMAGKQYTFRAKPERLNIYHEMGVDLALLANNHVYDFGKDAFMDMLGHFKEYNIPYIGAGKNLNEATSAYYIVLNGYKIAFLNATRAEKYILTPGATNTSEGVFRCYDPARMISEIKKAKEESDFVIANIHFGKEMSHDLEKEQTSSARKYIDAGADMVVGHHAHVLQGVEMYKDKPIIYNLGNYIFNSLTIDTAIFEVRMDSKGNMEYYMIPAIQKNCMTNMANAADKKRIIKDLNSWSINAKIDENGKITKK